MRTFVRAQDNCARIPGYALAAILLAAPPAAAQAQPNGAPPGSIMIARDVPIHNIFVPQPPGTPTVVRTVPGPDIFGSTIHNLVPLGDGEVASITASTDPRTAGFQGSSPGMLGRTDLLQRGGSANAFVSNQSGGGVVGSAIGGGMSALQQGLGALGSVLSGGQK